MRERRPLNISGPLGNITAGSPLNAQFPAAPSIGSRTYHGGGPRGTKVSQRTDAPLPKLLDSFCVGFFPRDVSPSMPKLRLIVPLGKKVSAGMIHILLVVGIVLLILHSSGAVPEQHRGVANAQSGKYRTARDERILCLC